MDHAVWSELSSSACNVFSGDDLRRPALKKDSGELLDRIEKVPIYIFVGLVFFTMLPLPLLF